MQKLFTLILLIWSFTALAGPDAEESLDAHFANPGNLSDQQMYDAQNFVHEGKQARLIEEGCKNNKKARNCDESRVNEGVLFGNVEQHLGKGYAMIFGALPGMTKLHRPAKEAPVQEPGKKNKSGKEEMNDYCLYGAIAYEGISGLMQATMQDKAVKESAHITDPQVSALVNLKKTHEAREKTALYQGVAYSAITACYGAYIYQGASSDPKLWVKMGGAALLSTVFYLKSAKHSQAAKAVNNVIKSLPDPGDCNPYTGTSCFCSETSSKDRYPAEYQEVCVQKNNVAATPVTMGCGVMVEGKMEFDKECKCKQTNTCFKVALKGISPKLNIGKNFMDQANTGFDLLSNGQYDVARLNNYSTSSKAMIGQIKDKLKPNIPAITLSAEQKKAAEEYKEILPEALAHAAAIAPVSDSPVGLGIGPSDTAALENLPGPAKHEIAEKVKVNYKSGGQATAHKAQSEDGFKMPIFGKKPANDRPGTEVVSFAEKAISQADVSNAPETPLFDIISNRYRRSGWTKLQRKELE